LEVAAYRELLLRQRINDAARSVMLAYARGSDLDHLAALLGVTRLNATNDKGDVTFTENDEDLRQRIMLSLEGFSTAGPIGAYHYHGMSADSDVKDISVTSPAPGEVCITVLSRSNTGSPSAALVQRVEQYLNADTRRPLTDKVTVQAAQVINYRIEAALMIEQGPDPQVIREHALQEVINYTQLQHRLGHSVTLSGIYAALHRPGVHNVVLTSPTADVTTDLHRAPYCQRLMVNEASHE
jgi:phage-related baseplate assembly protein